MGKMNACCGFGHREVFENISQEIDNSVLDVIKQGCTIFYTGAMGDFDNLFCIAVRKAQKSYPNIKLICVKPYLTKDINENREYLYTLYDDVIVPTEIADIHYKSVITKRNQWIIRNSSVVILYIRRDFGGAHAVKKYAEKIGKSIIYI